MNSLITRNVQKLPYQTRLIFLTSLYGLAAGLAAVAFQSSVNALFNSFYLALANQSKMIFLLGSLSLILATSLFVGFLLNNFCKEASGSGIPQLKVAFWKDFGFIPWRVVWVKFAAGVLSIGGGCSLGREGPSVQLAGSLASNLAGVAGEPKQSRRIAAAAGAAAGLAAAFNTPLAAVTFVLEEIIGDLNNRMMGSVLLASVIGAFVVHGFVGKQPAFTLNPINSPSWWVYFFVPISAALATLFGVLFQKLTLGLRAERKNFRHLPPWVRPALGGIITWALGSMVFLTMGRLGVFGLGYDDLSAALANQLSWKVAVVLLVCKLIATFTCYGFGGCGGIFSPTLFLGGMCGILVSAVCGQVVHLTGADQILLAVVGMSACLGAVVRAPVTGILIVFEMTHEFALVPSLMVGALISQAISRKLCHHNFYQSILVQDGHDLVHVIPPRDLQSWQQLPVSAIANFHPVMVSDLSVSGMEKILKEHPYQRFPVIQEEKVKGILTRKEAGLAIAQRRSPKLEEAVFCQPTETILDLQKHLINASTLMVLMLDPDGGRILGLVSIHDMLRAQMMFAHQDTG